MGSGELYLDLFAYLMFSDTVANFLSFRFLIVFLSSTQRSNANLFVGAFYRLFCDTARQITNVDVLAEFLLMYRILSFHSIS